MIIIGFSQLLRGPDGHVAPCYATYFKTLEPPAAPTSNAKGCHSGSRTNGTRVRASQNDKSDTHRGRLRVETSCEAGPGSKFESEYSG